VHGNCTIKGGIEKCEWSKESEPMKNEVFEIDHSKPRKVRAMVGMAGGLLYPGHFSCNSFTGKISLYCVSAENEQRYLKRGYEKLKGDDFVLSDVWEQIPEPQERLMTLKELYEQSIYRIVILGLNGDINASYMVDVDLFNDRIKYRHGSHKLESLVNELGDNCVKWSSIDNPRELRSFEVDA
jgi:hypothetical protein